MSKKTTLIIAILLTAITWAQSPEKMSYQAVVRNADNTLVENQKVGMQVSILKGNQAGTPVYVETQTPTSNANGLVSIEIGTGTIVDGTFSAIDWATDTYFIKTETDPSGGVNYSITGTSQLLSVPYALHAKTAGSIANDQVNDADADPTNEIELPSGGTNGQVLKTDGSGNYTWVDQTTSADNSVANEVNTSVVLNGTDLEITDGAGTITTDLSSLSTIALEHQLFTSSGTFAVPNNVTAIRVSMIGGGGGGGGRAAGPWVGDGGSAGAFVKNQIIQVTPGVNITVTVGAGGAGSTCANPLSSSCSVNPGGASSIGTLSAAGGAGGCASCLDYGSDVSGEASPFANFGKGGNGRTDSGAPNYNDVPATAGTSGMVLIEYYFW